MNINLSRFSKTPLYQQIIDEIKRNILNGKLQEREQLPSIRALARDLDVSVITVKKAYESLEQAGFLMTIPSQGTYVAELNLELLEEKIRAEIDDYLDAIVSRAQTINLSTEDLQALIQRKMEADD